jgi:polyvinyl alcohol dehydrogenase (cytochrome)
MFSFSSQALLHQRPNGKGIVIAGQKWGYVYGLDADDGTLLWREKIAEGGDLGGVQYGFSADPKTAYISISDVTADPPAKPGGLVALDIETGQTRWRAAPQEPVCSWGRLGCSSAQASATTTIPGIVFSGAWDGHLRAYSSSDGAVVWDVDTAMPVDAVNGVKAQGGQLGGYPVVIVDGAVYVTSGASSQARPGNALLVYTVDGK